jgi:hypothetical protein
MINLIEIIQKECIPIRNCMLTVVDINGESGFLYFRDAQLIEVNQGALWGRHAFEVILGWQIASHSISDTPMGIKRTLWEPVDTLIDEILGQGAAEGLRDAMRNLPAEPAKTSAQKKAQEIKRNTQRVAFTAIQSLPGFLALFYDDNKGIHDLVLPPDKELPDEKWLLDLEEECNRLGYNLGAGLLRDWYFYSEKFQAWRVKVKGGGIIVFAETSVETDMFELQLKEAASPLEA